MTAADRRIAQGIVDLREQIETCHQVDPQDVITFLKLVEDTLARTSEIEIYKPVPFPRGGRQTWPAHQLDRPRPDPRPTVVPFRSSLCQAPHPSRAVRCSEPPRHDEAPNGTEHVARGVGGRELARWSGSSTDRPPA